MRVRRAYGTAESVEQEDKLKGPPRGGKYYEIHGGIDPLTPVLRPSTAGAEARRIAQPSKALQLPAAVPGCNFSRTNFAPAAKAFIFPKATSAGRYFIPQSDAATSRSAPTNGNARLIRAATNSADSTS